MGDEEPHVDSCVEEEEVATDIAEKLEEMHVTDQGEVYDTRSWLQFAHRHKYVKMVEADVPESILPPGYTGTLIDVKVGGKGGPDDRIYNQHEELRDKIARGNCLLRLHHGGKTWTTFLVYALKKFTGGMGDEDNSCNTDDQVWRRYFLGEVDDAETIVCTQKANGEAAHFSACKVGDKTLICTGSKNVHMLLSCRDDIEKYSEGRYNIARVVAKTVMDVIEDIGKKRRQRLLKFLLSNRYTGVCEVLQPTHQHVENLSYLTQPELRFVAWTKPYVSNDKSFCAVPAHEGIDKARSFGLKTVDYKIIPAYKAEDEMNSIRKHYGYEGKVLYFLDSHDNVLGLVKKKTAWYVLSRAIREKSCTALGKKGGGSEESGKKVKKRVKEIQSWLQFSSAFGNAWAELGAGYIRWLLSQKRRNKFDGDPRSMFPILWARYLAEEDKSDKFDWDIA